MKIKRLPKERILPIARLLLVIAAPFLWYWLFGWGTVHIIDFSAQEVEYVQISCSHCPGRGTIYDSGEIQALIDEANAMKNKGTNLKKIFRGIGFGGVVLYDCDFYLVDGTEFLLTYFSSKFDEPASNRELSYSYRFSPTGEDNVGPMCQGSMEVYFQLFEKYNHRPAPGAEQDAR